MRQLLDCLRAEGEKTAVLTDTESLSYHQLADTASALSTGDENGQLDAGARTAISPSCVIVAAMAPSEETRLPDTTPRPRAAAGERHSSRFHSSARTVR